MFGLADLISLIISAFIILPIVIFLRESGYVLVSLVLGVKNPRLTLGSGPRIVKIGMFDIRKYYHLYSWFSYDSLKREGKFAYVMLYAGPILVNLVVALIINAMLANDLIQEYVTFWDRFIFYAFYYVLFDIVPMKTANGKPNNGLIIYEMLRYGRRTDYNDEPFIPGTSEVEEEYQEEMEKIEELKERQKEEAEENADTKKEEKEKKAEIEKSRNEELEELDRVLEQEKAEQEDRS
ncbi:hypothetical protein [Planococcus beigongshangi]|uniref:hypothetical protein n=1 Tax=Planococcus beigongshangi TaxID=2782536 RepID=UPI00193B4F36|nr:hypothetical protein [Planococcus beigongshangi]